MSEPTLRFTTRLGHVAVPMSEIVYLQASHKYVSAFTADGKEYLTDMPLVSFEQLYPEFFIRIRRDILISRRMPGYRFRRNPANESPMGLVWITTPAGQEVQLPVSRRELTRVRVFVVEKNAPPVCRCDLRTKLVGDGCSVCNPTLAKDQETENE